MPIHPSIGSCRPLVIFLALLGICGGSSAILGQDSARSLNPPSSSTFEKWLPSPAQLTAFEESPDLQVILEMEPTALRDLIPSQAGLHYVRCPVCSEVDGWETFQWSLQESEIITCQECQTKFPNETIPLKIKNVVPMDSITVRPGIVHHYPYHTMTGIDARYPGERLYLDAKRDQLKQRFFSQFALFAAVSYRNQPPEDRDPNLALRAAIILLRFAQVYPDYSVHYDQPNRPKFFQTADLLPPYRQNFGSAKWRHSAALNVPIELLITYLILRSDPSIDEAGRLLGESAPHQTIEDDFLNRTAEFLLGHPDPHSVHSINAAEGLLMVGRFLGDERLEDAGLRMLDRLARLGFYHDGHWRSSETGLHPYVLSRLQEVLGITKIDLSTIEINDVSETDSNLTLTTGDPGAQALSILPLAQRAEDGLLQSELVDSNLRRAAWPSSVDQSSSREAKLLGGIGMARLSTGVGPHAIDFELRGFGDESGKRYDRLAIRLAIGGRLVLGDLDELPASNSGWELATASHNTVVVNGFNQRESIAGARELAPGSDIRFFAATPHFQVASMSDRSAYPSSSTRYRRTIALIDDQGVRYGVDIFELGGGLQYDHWLHSAPGLEAVWSIGSPTVPGPETLLPQALRYLPSSRVEDGRWFVQSYGAFRPLRMANLHEPAVATLSTTSEPILRTHLLSLGATTVFSAQAPDPTLPDPRTAIRGALMSRRKADSDQPIQTAFVRLFEEPGASGLDRIGRLESEPGVVVLVLETLRGVEFLIFNSTPGTTREIQLQNDVLIRTDSLLVRVNRQELVMAGGTFAEIGGRRLEQERVSGLIESSVRSTSSGGRGWFETNLLTINRPERLIGRTLIVTHGRRRSRAWTIQNVVQAPGNRVRFVVVEEPGFLIERETRRARYYQFPNEDLDGPHEFTVAQIGRYAPLSARGTAPPSSIPKPFSQRTTNRVPNR